MKLFPFVLLRLAGLSLDKLAGLHGPTEGWPALLEQIAQRAQRKDLLSQQLSDFIQRQEDYRRRHPLQNLRRDLHRDRRLRLDKYAALFTGDASARALANSFREWEAAGRELEAGRQRWREQYAAEVLRHRHRLQALVDTPALLLGLPFSSTSSEQRLRSYRHKDPLRFRKKELQRERTLLQFLTRMASKTSPFSHFTTLSAQSKIHLNNYLLAYWQTILEGLPGFYGQLPLVVNPSWRRTGAGYTFLLNSRNVESIQELAEHPLVAALVTLLADGSLPFAELLEKALEWVDAEPEELAQFIRELIDYGVLEWDWPLSGRSVNWLEDLRELLRRSPPFAEQADLQRVLDGLAEGKRQLEQVSAEQRAPILLEMQRTLEAGFAPYLSGEEASSEAQGFQRIGVGEFNFRAEKLVYEDVSSAEGLEWSVEDGTSIARELDRLLLRLEGIAEWPWEKAIAEHYTTHYGDRASVDLLSFYDSFYRRDGLGQNEQQLRPEWVDPLLDQLRAADYCDTQSGHCRLPWSFIDNCLPAPDSIPREQGPAQAALVQLERHEGQWRALVEANLQGYGKMMGRFLHLFPKELTQAIRSWNAAQCPDSERWIENVDASYFNANIYPPLLDWELAAPGSQNELPPQQRIALVEVEVFAGPHGPQLRHRSTQQRLRPFNFGLEALGNRSAMYRLLQAFAYRSPSTDLLVQLVDAAYGGTDDRGVWHFPRIALGDHLLLQRRRWYFPRQTLPTYEQSEADFFLAVQTWRRQWRLPRHVFIRISPRMIPTLGPQKSETENRRNDDYKPQWIDLEQALLVQLLARLLKRVDAYLEVVEMWPSPERAPRIDGRPRAVEVLLEWTRT